MTASAALITALLSLAGLLVLLSGVVAGQRARRLRADRRRAEVAEPLRPWLLRLAAGEPDEAAQARDHLAALDERRWNAIEPSIEALLTKVRGETRASVVSLLERRGTLARALARTGSSSVVARAHAAEVLGAAGHHGALPELVRLLTDPEPEVRQVAARALGRSRAAGAAPSLLVSLSADRPIPPRIVATAVMRIGVGAHHALDAALRHGDALQRAVAADIAGLSGAVAASRTLVHTVSQDPELEVRIRSARALGRIGTPMALEPLLRSIEAGQPQPLRVVAARALGDLGDPRAVPQLALMAAAAEHRVAANAATALTRCGVPGLRALRRLASRPEGAHARDALASAALRGTHPAGADDDDVDAPDHGLATPTSPAEGMLV